jgi:YcxB-like protein
MTREPKPKPELIRETNNDVPSLELPGTAERPGSASDRLRGLMREEFAEHGGGEAFLKRLRTDPEDDGPRKWWTTMEIRYTLTIPEFQEGYFVMLRNSTWRYRIFRWQFTWLGPLMGAFLIGRGSWLLLGSGTQVPWAILSFAIGLLGLSAPVRLRSSIRRQFRLGGLDQEIAMNLGSGGISIKRVSRDAESHYGWSAIEKVIESQRLITLLPNKVQFIPIPKRAVRPEQLQELRALLAEHVLKAPAAERKTVS